jgi:tetratricopeptide (TPR) repeat protein
LGTVYHSSGKYDKAAAAWEQAVAINANTTVVQYNLACAYARMNNKDKAIEVLNKIAPSGFFQPEQISADADFTGLQNDVRFKEVLAQAQKAARPCTAAPEFRQFDFWIGEWDVQSNGSGQTAGKSSVQLMLGDCVIFENWTGALGVNGKSFNVYNTAQKQWRQTWVDDRGTLTDYSGEFKGDRLEYYAESIGANGQKQKLRMTFFKQGADRVRQLGEVSTDEGKTWSTRYDLIYNRRK